MNPNTIVREIDRVLPGAPFARPGGSLLIMVGLPGSGKSLVVERLCARLPCAVISTDRVRFHMRGRPTYTAAEMVLVYEICQRLIELRLRRGQRVIFDGTNYLAARRQQLARLAERQNAALAVCLVQASEQAIRQRLDRRADGLGSASDISDAGWSVYHWMVQAQEPVVGPHLILDTTPELDEPLVIRLHDYWLACEALG